MDNYFVDSTIWVEFFKGSNEIIRALVTPLIDEDRIYYNGIVLSELLTGALNKKEFDFLRSNFGGLHYLETSQELFEAAGQLGFSLRRKGVTIPLSDLVIAAHCNHHHLRLLTLDNHFRLIEAHSKLDLEPVSIDPKP